MKVLSNTPTAHANVCTLFGLEEPGELDQEDKRPMHTRLSHLNPEDQLCLVVTSDDEPEFTKDIPVSNAAFRLELKQFDIDWPIRDLHIAFESNITNARNPHFVHMLRNVPLPPTVLPVRLKEKVAFFKRSLAYRTTDKCKTAVLLSGNLRTLPLTADLFAAHVLGPLTVWGEVHVFFMLERLCAIKTWYEIGADIIQVGDSQSLLQEILECWEKMGLKLVVHPVVWLTSEEVRANTKLYEQKFNVAQNIALNVVHQYANLRRCLNTMKEYELAVNEQFTHVLKIRPDICPISPVTFDLSLPGITFGGGGSAFTTDQCFFGVRNDMEKIIRVLLDEWHCYPPPESDLMPCFLNAPEHQIPVISAHHKIPLRFKLHNCYHIAPENREKNDWLFVFKERAAAHPNYKTIRNIKNIALLVMS